MRNETGRPPRRPNPVWAKSVVKRSPVQAGVWLLWRRCQKVQ